MVTLDDAAGELAAAITAAGVPVADAAGEIEPPSAIIFGEGIPDMTHVMRGAVLARFRLTVIAGLADERASTAVLRGLVQDACGAVRGLAGWRLDEVRRDYRADIAESRYFAADVIASRNVDIT